MLTKTYADSLYLVREPHSFRHTLEIAKPYGFLDNILDWCKSECISDWRWQLIDVSSDRRPGRYCFYFDSERDYLAFVIKWS